jgi:hypothetical protein
MPEAPATSSTENSRFPLLVPTIIAAIYFLAHMATATRYGYFRDALYLPSLLRTSGLGVRGPAAPDRFHCLGWSSHFIRYQAHLPFGVPKSEHNQDEAILPQHYSDEFGWEDMVAGVANVYRSLTPEEQSRTAIFASNYGEAGAVDFFGSRYGLPKAICTHQNYFLWGPRNYTGEIVIRIGTKPEDARDYYESVSVATTLDNRYAMPYERKPILLCRHRKKNLQTDWPDIKNWD